jgi:hypothetical protein
MYAYHAAPWSPPYNERDRTTHHKRTKQRTKEEWTSWTREKEEWRTSWTWEEVMAGDKTLPWKQVERAQEERQRYEGTRLARKPERHPQYIFLLGGAHEEIA